MHGLRSLAIALSLATLATPPVIAQEPTPEEATAILQDMLLGRSSMKGAELEGTIAKAEAHPLGSEQNPVRVAGAADQRGYLSRLRCADLKRPRFERIGSMGMSRYGNIVDGYAVTCKGSEPAERTIYMDMYHAGHVEDRAIEGYGITGGRKG